MANEPTNEPSDQQIMEAILTRPSVSLWPHAGRALGLKRGATYLKGRTNVIPTIEGISRNRDVPTSWLREKLGLRI
jgi:hypothetical protein